MTERERQERAERMLEHATALVRERTGEAALVTRYVLVAELATAEGRTLWRISGPPSGPDVENLLPWDLDGLLHAALHGYFDDPDDQDDSETDP